MATFLPGIDKQITRRKTPKYCFIVMELFLAGIDRVCHKQTKQNTLIHCNGAVYTRNRPLCYTQKNQNTLFHCNGAVITRNRPVGQTQKNKKKIYHCNGAVFTRNRPVDYTEKNQNLQFHFNGAVFTRNRAVGYTQKNQDKLPHVMAPFLLGIYQYVTRRKSKILIHCNDADSQGNRQQVICRKNKRYYSL